METVKNFDNFLNEKVEAVKAEAKRIANDTVQAIESAASTVPTQHQYNKKWMLDEVIRILEATKETL